MNAANFILTPIRGKQALRRASFELPCSAARAFGLFTPEGERAWIEGWDPIPIYPEQITFAPNTVFELFQEGERSIWTILKADMATMEAEYVYFVLVSRVTRMRVQVKPVGADACKVLVEFTVTGFTDAGDRFVDLFSDEMFARKMQTWRQGLTKALPAK